MIRAIAAIDDKRGIAAAGRIPWHIPQDGQYFRDQTEHSTIIMGKATHQIDIAKPLPNRRNIIVSHSLKSAPQGFELISDMEEFLELCTDDVWIVGGQGLYEAALSYCDELYLTHIEGDFKSDRFFPDYCAEFSLAQESAPQHDNGYSFKYAVYHKNR